MINFMIAAVFLAYAIGTALVWLNRVQMQHTLNYALTPELYKRMHSKKNTDVLDRATALYEDMSLKVLPMCALAMFMIIVLWLGHYTGENIGDLLTGVATGILAYIAVRIIDHWRAPAWVFDWVNELSRTSNIINCEKIKARLEVVDAKLAILKDTIDTDAFDMDSATETIRLLAEKEQLEEFYVELKNELAK